jgi:hypothetical protein
MVDEQFIYEMRMKRAKEEASWGKLPSSQDHKYLEAYHRECSMRETPKSSETDFIATRMIVSSSEPPPLMASHFQKAEWHRVRSIVDALAKK